MVEYQPKVRFLLRRQLMRLGYVVVDVADARAALERLEDPRIKVLLTDIVLPGDMDGVRLGEAALARRPELALVLTGRWPMSCVNPTVLPASGLRRWQPVSMERGPNS